MAHQGYLCFGGMEIVNNERVYTYARKGWANGVARVEHCNSCGPDIAIALGHENGYNNPGTDKAPWYTPTEQHSADFGGFYVTDITGLGPGLYTRDTTARASGQGSFLGRPVQAAPVVRVTGLLFGRTCCSVDYGMTWLSNVLRGSCAGGGCKGDDLTFLDCCPDFCNAVEDDDLQPGDVVCSHEECLSVYQRTLKGVGLTSSPQIIERFGNNCGCCQGCGLMQISFDLTASQACVFRNPDTICYDQPFGPEESACHTWVPIPSGGTCPDPCAEPMDCLLDPSCPPSPPPPRAPAVLNPCVCLPLSTRRSCVDIPPDAVPEFSAGVPVVQVFAGSKDMRQVTIRFYANPLDRDPADLDPCAACGEVTISRIARDSTFILDGVNRTVTITCPGSAVTDASPLLGSTGGRLPFSFPEIECGGTQYTMCVEAATESVADDATVSLDIVVKDC